MKKIWFLFFISLIFITNSYGQYSIKIDYSNPDNWAALPDRNDAADLIPGNKGIDMQKDSKVDIFFVYPTSYSGKMKDGKWNADINDAEINDITDKESMKYQASLFNQVGKIYAPRYRQAHLSVYFTLDKDNAAKALDLAYRDVRDAFLYYLKYYNNGRPFIIASHSQGTSHATRLIKEEVEDKPIEQKLIVAYLIGMPLDSGYLKIPPCIRPDQTDCICGWRTFIHDYTPEYVWLENPSIVTNPITWVPDTDYSPWKAHKGAVLKDFKKIRPATISAKRTGNILWIKDPKIKGLKILNIKNYHVGDLNLFYKDIQDNAILRSNAYLSWH